jgi:hypothetical protein
MVEVSGLISSEMLVEIEVEAMVGESAEWENLNPQLPAK